MNKIKLFAIVLLLSLFTSIKAQTGANFSTAITLSTTIGSSTGWQTTEFDTIWYKYQATGLNQTFDVGFKNNFSRVLSQVLCYRDSSRIFNIAESNPLNDSTIKAKVFDLTVGEVHFLALIFRTTTCNNCIITNSASYVINSVSAPLTYQACSNSTVCSAAPICEYVCNGSFEILGGQNNTVGSFPDDVSQISLACGWNNAYVGNSISGGSSTVDLYSTISPPIVKIPCNNLGNETERTGGGSYAGFFAYTPASTNGAPDYKEALYSQLKSPLLVGHTYNVSFYLSMADQMDRNPLMNNVGVAFSNSFNPGSYHNATINAVSGATNYFNTSSVSKTGWQQFSFSYSPTSANEQIIVIGALQTATSATVVGATSVCAGQVVTPWKQSAYYYLDDVSVTEITDYTITPHFGAGCPPPIDGLSVAPSNAAGSYTWTSSPVTPTLSTQHGYSVSINPTSTTIYTVDALGCGTETISVDPAVVTSSFAITSSTNQICAGTPVVLSASSSGLNTFTWTSSPPTPGLSSQHGDIVNVPPSVTTTYTAIGAYAGCPTTFSAVITVSVITGPSIGISTSSVVCAGAVVTVTAGVGTTLGTVVFYDANNQYMTNPYTFTAPGSYTVYADASESVCNTFGSTEIPITVLPAGSNPTLTISPSQTICAGQASTLNVSGATSYTWSTSANTNSIVVSPTVTTTYTVTGASTCGTATAQVTVYIASPPIISVNNATICAGKSATLTATGGSTYVWSNGATTSSVVVAPTVTTQYTVTGTTSAGCTNTAIATVSVNPSPSFIFTPSNITSATICASTNYTLIPSNIGLTYSCNPTPVSVIGNSIVVNPSTTTVYTVTGTNANGCSFSKTFTVNILSVTQISVTSATLCYGSSATLTATGSTSAVNYTWSTGATGTNSIVVSPTSNTTYTVTGATTCGTLSAVSNVIVYALPSVNIVSSNTICSGTTVNLIGTPLGAGSYSWSTGSTSNPTTVTPPVTSVYSLTLTNSVGCSNVATKTITVLPTPTISVAATSYTICRGSSTTLTATGATNYTWSPAATLSSANGSVVVASPNTSTTYTVSGSNGNGCISTQTISIIVNPLPSLITVIAQGGVNVCVAGTRTLVALPNNSSYNYTWSNGYVGNPNIVSPSSTTNYTVTVTNTVTGCSKQGTITINVLPPSSITVSASSQTICAGQNTTLTASGANVYSWAPSGSIYPPANGSSVVAHPTTSTIYTVTGSVASCSATQTIAITVNPNPTVTVTNTLICAGTSATLTANGASSYSWNTGATTNTLSVSPTVSTSYTVIGTSALGCTATAISVVSVSPSPSLSVNSATICSGQSATLTANGASSYSWSTGQTTNSIVVSPTSTTDYTVIGSTLAGCTATAVSNVNVLTGPTSISSISSNNYPIIGTSVNITTNVTPPGAYTYIWSPNIGNTANPVFTPTDNAVYVCTVSNACGSATTSLCIDVESTLCASIAAISLSTQTLSSATVFANTTISITGTLTLAGSNQYDFNNCTVMMGTNSKIIVEPTALLSIVGSQIFSCQDMWYGIEAQSSAVGSASVQVKQSTIEDAYNSMVMDNLNFHVNNYIETSTTVLNKNYIDISISNARLATTVYSLAVLTTTMSSAASITSPGNSLKCSSFYPAGVPLVKARSFAGLFADNAQYIEFVDNNLSVFNQVSNKDYGLFFKKTNAWVYNVQFSNIVGSRSIVLTPGGTPPLPVGIAIYHAGKEFLKAMPYTTAVPNALLFTNVAYGIVTNKTPSVDVEQASFINPAQYRITSFGSGTETGIGLNAVYTIDAFGLLRVNQNKIMDELNAITASYNALPTSTSYTFSLSENNISTSISTTTLSTGIDVMGVTTLPFNGLMGDQVIAANTIKNARNAGIRLLSVQTPNGLRVSGNNIYLPNLTSGTRDGIILNGNNSNVLVDNNFVDGGLTASPVGNFNINCSGIRCVKSPGCFIQCNKITNTGKGIVYSGNNLTSGPYAAAGFYHNYLTYPMRRGLELNNGGIIGTQGNNTAASANQWIGFTNITGVDETFVGGGFPASNAGNSVLWVRNIVGSERPLDNQNGAPSTPADRYQGASLPLLASGVNDVETAPGYSACPVPLNSGAKVALTVPLNITQRNVDYSTLITSVVTATATNMTAQQKWQLKQHMHKAIRQTQVGVNTTVANFYANEQAGDAAKYYLVDSLMASGDTALARANNNSAPVNNAIELTHHDFNNLYLSGITSQTDYVNLENIANLCAYKYGNAVYQARALLNITTYGNQSWEDDNCEDDKSDGRMGNFGEEEQGIALTETIKASLYPNPNNGNFTLAYDLKQTPEATIQLLDVTGKIVYTTSIDNLNNIIQINTNDLHSGIYFIQLMNKNSLLWTDKVMISK